MNKRLFRYKIINALVIIFNFLMIFIIGFGTYDTYNLFKSETNNITLKVYAVLSIGVFMFLLACIGLIMVIARSSRSILILNIFYGFLAFGLLASLLLRKFNDVEENISLENYLTIGAVVFLIVLINKFRYKELHYESIEFIGKHED